MVPSEVMPVERDELLRQMIADYRRRIETYQSMIQEWERELGKPGSTVEGGTGNSAVIGATLGLPQIGAWQFMGKSQNEAVKMLFLAVGHPLTTEEVMDGLRRGGTETRSSKLNFYSALGKMDGIVRVKRNTWGLQEWGVKAPSKALRQKPKRKARSTPRQAKPKSLHTAEGGGSQS
jgi:hypothetical protein